ncbi:MAG: NAD-dependent epimerase/dehydratase family protein, partial [Actinomycetota bacterium]|nr:NAD-dependent epimerase/dehydratase family protein [Actinomycetota bacterium]
MVGEHVAVTGASGYLGQHLVRRLADEGWRVSAVMRRPPSSPVPVSVEVILADVTDHAALDPYLRGVDAVVHLACLPMNPSRTNPRQAFEINALGTFNVLEACRQNAVGRIVVSSTAYVYG